MSKNTKNTPNSQSTSIVASTLMQKMLDGHTRISLQNQQITLPLEDIHMTKRKQSHLCDQIQSGRKLPPTSPTTQPQFKLNLQYHHPSESPSKNISNFLKLKNNSRLRQLKQLDQVSVDDRESKIMRHLRKNLVSLYGDRNMQLQRQRESMVKSQSDQSLRQEVKVESSEAQQKDKYIQRQKLPSKVSVNFQLYFPKQKLRTTINHTAAKTQTRRSINLTSSIMQKQLFRIKKSSKSISLTDPTQKTMQQLSSDLRQQQRQRQRFHEQVLVSLRKNSAIKYIEKIQKFKKYKDKKITKQPLFGLNVTQAEYHEVKVDTEGRKIREKEKEKNAKGLYVKENNKDTWTRLNQTEEQQERDIYLIDHKPHHHHHHRELTVNLAISVGPSLPMKNTTPIDDSEQKPSPMRQSQPMQSRQKDRKCPSEYKLTSKGFFNGVNSEIQRNKKYVKTRHEETWNRGGDNVFKEKLFSMLGCLDVILNAYCCKVAVESEGQKRGGMIENRTVMMIDSKISDSQVLVQSVNELGKLPQEGNTSIPSTNNTLISTAISPRVINLLKAKEKFLYFVGNGNNKNLIRSIMKKRGWWNETEKMQEANFIWTQLKVGSVLDKEQKMSNKIVQQPDSWHFKKGKQPQPDDTTTKLPRTTKLKISSHQIQKFEKLFHKNMLPLYHKRLIQKHKQHQYLRPLTPPTVLHNHYDANYMLGNKKALFYNVTEYCTHKKISPYTFIPMTFHIESTQSRQFKTLFKTAKKYKNSLWIVKPGENSNRGNGIFVEKDVEKIRKHIEKNATDKHSFIVQKYMKSIFLYNKRKFDIRTYMLMATIGGITKFFWYEEGYIRTSSEIYNTDDITDLFVHLTNDAIQAKNDTYSKYEKGNKVSYSEFQRYLDLNHSQEKYSVAELVASMKAIAETVVKATYSKLDKAKKVNGFQLFGLDFLIDKDFAPWLLQVNTNPCLELSSPVLQRLIPRMLENMFRMTIDPIYRPTENISRHSSYFLYDNLLEKNKFELIFDSLFDCDFEWEEICQKEKNVVYQDEDQVFESNGVQMEVGD